MLELDLMLTIFETAKQTKKINYLKERAMSISLVAERLTQAGFPDENDTEKRNIAADILVLAHLKHLLGLLAFQEMPTMYVVFQKLLKDQSIELECTESSYNDALDEIKNNTLKYF